MTNYIRSIKGRFSRNFRQLTAPVRLLPDFLILGASRCGTTSLHYYLNIHPAISMARKEVHFFDLFYNNGIGWYRQFFPTLFYKYYCEIIHSQKLLLGEATPYYLLHPLAPQRVSQFSPSVKLIVLLRNPVDRAYSDYWLQVKLGVETLSFEKAIDLEPERLKGEKQRIIIQDGRYYSFNHHRFSYLARSTYIDQILVWQRLFMPEQMLILRSEDFFEAPCTVYNKVCDFLNLPSYNLKSPQKHKSVDYLDMAKTTRESLNNYFRPHNERLYKLLNQNFEWENQ